jgi:hypothetical protein
MHDPESLGNLQCIYQYSLGDTASTYYGYYQRVRRENVDGRTLVVSSLREVCFDEPSGQWNRASEDFFESFRNYDEAGLPQRIQVLKYLVLANMLTGSEVNPFDSQETKPCVLYSFPLRFLLSLVN